MEKIIYLSKKLKAFTFDEIFLLAEMEKESLEKCLNELIENGTLKQDTQGYIYVEHIPTMIKDILKNSNTTKYQVEKFGIFIPTLNKFDKIEFSELVTDFLINYTKKFCSPSTLRNYQSIFNKNILPFFEDKDFEEIDSTTIKEFYLYCEKQNLTPNHVNKLPFLQLQTVSNLELKILQSYRIKHHHYQLLQVLNYPFY